MARTAWVAGASGMVGGFVLGKLLESAAYERVVALLRRPLPDAHPKLSQSIVDLGALSATALGPVDDVFCCLGTTLKKAGSRAEFRRVDATLVIDLARAARQAGASRFLLVSAVGADARSPNFYLSVKGEAEAGVRELGFRATHVFRPSLLLGERQESRPLEGLGMLMARPMSALLHGRWRKYRAVPAERVAAAMVAAATQDDRAGVFVHHLDEIDGLARTL